MQAKHLGHRIELGRSVRCLADPDQGDTFMVQVITEVICAVPLFAITFVPCMLFLMHCIFPDLYNFLKPSPVTLYTSFRCITSMADSWY